MAKLQYDYIKEYIEDIGFILVSKEYLGINKKMILKDKDDFYYTSTYANFRKGSVPFKYIKSNPYTIQNIKLWCKLNNKPFELISEKYENNSTLLKWKCMKDKCLSEFLSSWYVIQSGKGCGACHGKQVSLSNCLATKNPKLASEWHPTKNNGLTPYDVTSGSDKKVWWQCSKDHEHEWESSICNRKNYNCPYCAGQLPSRKYNLLVDNPELCKEWDYKKNKNNPSEYTPKSGQKVWWICKECKHEWFASISHRNNNRNCPQCNMSKGEIVINEYLQNNNIICTPQKEYNGLIGMKGKNLSYDFHLPKYNLLIEYQGQFHDNTVKKQTLEEFIKQQEHDKRKKEYAKNNNIELLEIWYWDFDNIEEILDNYLV